MNPLFLLVVFGALHTEEQRLESRRPLLTRAVDQLTAALEKQDVEAVEQCYAFPPETPAYFRQILSSSIVVEYRLDQLLRAKGKSFEEFLPLGKDEELVPAMSKTYLERLKRARLMPTPPEFADLCANVQGYTNAGWCSQQFLVQDRLAKRVCFAFGPRAELASLAQPTAVRNVSAAAILQKKWIIAKLVKELERGESTGESEERLRDFFVVNVAPSELPAPAYLKQQPSAAPDPRAEWRRIWFVEQPHHLNPYRDR